MRNNKIAWIGGDERTLEAAKAMGRAGYESALWGFDRLPDDAMGLTKCTTVCDVLAGADALILPIPVSGDGIRLNAPLYRQEIRLRELFPLLGEELPVFGGAVSPEVSALAAEYALTIHDYYARDELCVRSAIPTAEGALAVAINELPITLHGAKAAVVGYGRVARVLCADLHALGAQVTAYARKPSDFAWMEAGGIMPAEIAALEGGKDAVLENADLLFNTVPVRLITRPVLQRLKPGTLVIDLASKPGGVDFEAAHALGTRVIWALSLPARTAPVTAGRIMCDTLLRMLEEGEETV